jgi:hypothetical protein
MVVIMPPARNEVATARSCLVNSSSKTMYSEIITKQMDRKKQMNEITIDRTCERSECDWQLANKEKGTVWI